jgi:polysaccharide biosynthesis protein PslH
VGRGRCGPLLYAELLFDLASRNRFPGKLLESMVGVMASSEARFPKLMNVEPAARPLRIAIVYSRIPLPMRRADQMTVAHLTGFLHARGHAVDLYCINTGARAEPADIEWLKANSRSLHLYRHDLFSILRGLSKVVLKLAPVQVGLFSNPALRRDLKRKVASGGYDVVYTYYFRSAEMTRDLGRDLPSGNGHAGGPTTFLAMQLSQTLNTRRIAKNSPSLVDRLFYEVESRLVARYESRIWQHFTRTVLIGRSDVREISRTCEEYGQPRIHNYVFGAHGTDLDRFQPRTDIEEKPNRIVFSGVMRTPTNIQAVQWFVRNVWPEIREAVPDAVFAVVGREPSAAVTKLGAAPGVEIVGTVPDTSVPIAEAAVCVNPMQAGGGMQNKLLEYFASGKPVVSTSLANEGLNGVADEHLLIADEPTNFAQAVIRLLRDQPLRERLGRSARAFALRDWTWEGHFLKLERDIYAAVDASNASASVELSRDFNPSAVL